MIGSFKKTDPEAYALAMNEYEFDNGQNHQDLVDSVISQVEGPIVVPADGIGRWARVWSGVGLFSDRIKIKTTHWRVKQESIRETLLRLSEFKGCTLILMFCQVFMKEEHEIVTKYLQGGGRLLYFDVVSPPSEWKMRAINDRIYEVGYPDLNRESSLQDMKIRKKGVKFSSTLLKIPNPRFLSVSVFSDYYNIMRPYRSFEEEETVVFATIEEEVEYLSPKHVRVDGQFYSAYIGVFDSSPSLFVPSLKLYSRTLYKAPLIWKAAIPHECLSVYRSPFIYFAYPEADTTVLPFIGSDVKLDCSLRLTFWSLREEMYSSTSTDILYSLFSDSPGIRLSKAQIMDSLPGEDWEMINMCLGAMKHVAFQDGLYVSVVPQSQTPVIEYDDYGD